MIVKLDKEIVEALNREDRPVEIQDATGTVYVVMTREQFQKYVYDDSELTEEEMLAAAASQLEDPEGWGDAGLDSYDREEPETSS